MIEVSIFGEVITEENRKEIYEREDKVVELIGSIMYARKEEEKVTSYDDGYFSYDYSEDQEYELCYNSEDVWVQWWEEDDDGLPHLIQFSLGNDLLEVAWLWTANADFKELYLDAESSDSEPLED